jgi:hypothetical protein
MDEERGVRAECRGGEREPERGEQEREPDGADLGERLEVEAVRIANLGLSRPELVPVSLVAA